MKRERRRRGIGRRPVLRSRGFRLAELGDLAAGPTLALLTRQYLKKSSGVSD